MQCANSVPEPYLTAFDDCCSLSWLDDALPACINQYNLWQGWLHDSHPVSCPGVPSISRLVTFSAL